MRAVYQRLSAAQVGTPSLIACLRCEQPKPSLYLPQHLRGHPIERANNMGQITRAQIEGAIHGVTGAPSSGLIHDWTPAIVDAIDALLNPKAAKETRVVKAPEVRDAEDK
jgi:hypothetical protein